MTYRRLWLVREVNRQYCDREQVEIRRVASAWAAMVPLASVLKYQFTLRPRRTLMLIYDKDQIIGSYDEKNEIETVGIEHVLR